MLVDVASHQVDYCSRGNSDRPEVIDPFELAAMSFGASAGGFEDSLVPIEFPVESDEDVIRNANVHLDNGNATDDHDYCGRSSRTTKHDIVARRADSDDKSGTMTRADCDGLPVQSLSSSSMRFDALRHLLLDVNLPDEVRRQSEIDREASRLKMSAKTSAAEAASEFLARLLKLALAREMQEKMQPQIVSVSSPGSTFTSERPRASNGNSSTGLYSSKPQNYVGNDVMATALQSFVSVTNGTSQANAADRHTVDQLDDRFNRIPASPVDIYESEFDGPVEEIGGEETIETMSIAISEEDPDDDQFRMIFLDQMTSHQPDTKRTTRNTLRDGAHCVNTTNALIDTEGYRIYDIDDDNNINNNSPQGSDAATESAPETNDLDDVYEYFDDVKVSGDELGTDLQVIEDSSTTELVCDVEEDTDRGGDVPEVNCAFVAAAAEGVYITDESLPMTSSENSIQSSPTATDLDLVERAERGKYSSSLTTGSTKLRLIGRSKTWRVPSSSVTSVRPKFRWVCRRSMTSPKSTVVGRRCLMTRGSS